jgi:glucose-6-phosphate 1-dehydrogenase
VVFPASAVAPRTNQRAERSDALVFFGATGDLAYKKIFPALIAMVRSGALDVPVIGVAKSAFSREQLIDRAHASITEHAPHATRSDLERLDKLLDYVDGDYTDPATFDHLRRALGSAQRPLHYLAVPPSLFAAVVQGLGRSGSARNARVIIEKPFGRDRASARSLNDAIHNAFPESAVFRIDHYLGKESVENLLYFRFANTLFEPIWNHHYIASVQITLAENFGVQGRGRFYDETGAIRDVLQNHLLQIVGLLAMEPPGTIYHEAIRDEHVKVLRAIPPMTSQNVVRGQFDGYRSEPGVAKDSMTETFAAVRLEVDSWRWAGVPWLIRAGKYLPATACEVLVRFQRPPLTHMGPRDTNYVRLRLGPELAIAIGARVKRMGPYADTSPVEMAMIEPGNAGEMDPYARLLADAIDGEGLLFVREDAVEAAWAVVDPILDRQLPLHTYAPNTWGPAEAEEIAAGLGGWHNPT